MYRTVSDIADDMKKIIDSHWRLEISEIEIADKIKEIFDIPKNRGLALRGSVFSSTFERKLGKKRIHFLKSVLKRIDSQMYHFN